MKTLLLMRHAKSSWKNEKLADFERPLNGRGTSAAKLMGDFIRKRKLPIKLVLSSPAVRARETTRLVTAMAKLSAEVRFDERIYEAGPLRLLQIITEVEPNVNQLLLVGHNPGLTELLQLLTGEERQMSTATLAKIDLPNSLWSKTKVGNGKLDWLVKPKDLNE